MALSRTSSQEESQRRDHAVEIGETQGLGNRLPTFRDWQAASGVNFDILFVDQEPKEMPQERQAAGHASCADAPLQ
jgi:hypothetical protein